MSTVSTRRFSRAGTPSSILSSDSDIRFTRKLGGQYRCGCCVLAAFLLFLLFSGVSIYLGCKYRSCRSSTGNIKVYKTFRSYLKSFYAKNLNSACSRAEMLIGQNFCSHEYFEERNQRSKEYCGIY